MLLPLELLECPSPSVETVIRRAAVLASARSLRIKNTSRRTRRRGRRRSKNSKAKEARILTLALATQIAGAVGVLVRGSIIASIGMLLDCPG